MSRVKEINRNSKHRKRNPVVYLICEGTETEIRYFKRFRTRYCHIDILPIPSQYKAADKLVQKVSSTLGSNPYYPDEGDQIWCVFDRDENTDEMLKRAETLAGKNGYHIAYSNPAFELWFLLHFVNQTTELTDCNAVIRQLKQKGRLENYKKSQDIYSILLEKQPEAIKRSENRIAELHSKNLEILVRKSNPVTTVSELVKYLNQHRGS